MVFVVDPKRLLGLPIQLADRNKRIWKVFTYDGNDLALRIAYRESTKGSEKLLVHAVPRSTMSPGAKAITLSYLGDLVATSNEIIDFSPHNILSDLYTDPLPTALYDEPLLSLWSRDIDSFLRNLKHYIKLSGKNQVLDRYDAIAISLSTAYPELCSIEQFVNLPYDPIEKLRRYVRLMLATKHEELTHELLSALFRGSEDNQTVAKWTSIRPSSLRRLMFVYLAAQRYLIPTPLVTVRGQSLLDFDSRGLEKDIDGVAVGLNREPLLLRTLAEMTEDNFTEEEITRLAQDFRFGSHGDVVQSLANETSPLLSLSIAKKFLGERLTNDGATTALAKLDLASIENRETELARTKFKEQAARAVSILSKIAWLEKSIASATKPSSTSLDAIIEVYYRTNLYLLEFVLSEIADLTRLWKDGSIQSLLTQYLNRKRQQLDQILGDVDKSLAEKITSDWSGYTNYARLNTKILRDILQPGVPRKETVWIIVFDGLRLDSWEKVVWPRLQQYFVLEGDFNLYLSTLPSYTDISRVAFFAGALPPFWKDYFNKLTTNHKVLLPKLLGFNKDDAKTKVQIIARSEEKVEQQELGLGKYQYNALIFNISDTWIHTEKGSLIQVNETIQRKLESLVIPELENCIGPNDTVIVTSDHGFIELREQHRVFVDDKRDWNDFTSEYQSPIYYRYLRGIEHPSGKRVQYDSATWWTLPVGFTWYDRPKGRPTRYSHGGISMAEMVIPGIRLKKIVDRQIVLQMKVEPLSECVEGDIVELHVVLSNQGSLAADADVMLYASGRPIAQGKLRVEAGRSYRWRTKFEANEISKTIEAVASYRDHKGVEQSLRRNIEVPIKEGAKVRIDTSALDVFDN